MKPPSSPPAFLLFFLLLIGYLLPVSVGAQSNLCSSTPTLTSSPTCNNVSGSLTSGATYTTIPTLGCGGAFDDVWYAFVARSTNPTISLSSVSSTSVRVQLFSGTCAALTSLNCGTTSIAATGLTIGSTYFIRIYSNTNVAATFNICITDPPPANDNCAGAVLLTSGTTCSITAGNMQASTLSAATITAPSCAGTVVYDVWYSFVAQTTNPTITLSGIGSGFTSPNMQLLSNNCGSTFTPLYCGTTSIAAAHLTIGSTYYIRVYSSTGTSPANGANMDFDICVTDPVLSPPYNDNCANAINLPISSNCDNVPGTIAAATLSTAPLGACTGPVTYDVWYRFTAVSTSTDINLSSVGTNFTNSRIQVLSGACGSLTSLACGTTSIANFASTVGTTYYVRVYSTTAGAAPNGNADFSICVSGDNAPIRFGNSYVNISKKSTGGVVQTGDTLEIRMTINHKSGTLFNARYVDNVPTGTTMLTGATDRIRIITNEGLTYKAFTLAAGDDAATYNASPPVGQYNIRMNLALGGYSPGVPANTSSTEAASAVGRVLSTHNPRGGGGVLFAVAYRVRVTAATGSTITLNPGQFIYRTASAGADITLTATPFQILVTSNQTLCSNSIGLNNAVESGGTFGTGTTLNRGTDLANPIAGYTFLSNLVGSDPNWFYNIGDGKYGIIKNLSPRSGVNRDSRRANVCTTPTTLATYDPYNCSNRMFNHWYIDGDHTGTNNSIGNAPPAANTSSGYMLVVNADFIASEAYRQTISNLCPNTYYEFSAWFRNVCPTCGIDSIENQFAGIPTAPTNGYPGVYPNLTFAVDGIDHYSTGEIDTVGWVKKGFVFRTGASQTSATFTIRNNSQGGGGNDWAMDDISVSTCLPSMTYSPSTSPNMCMGNSSLIRDTIRSIYNTYQHYKWQRSTNGGGTWTDITSPAVGTPVFNGSEYEYVVSYTLAPSETQLTNDGDMYRVLVGTTASNLSSPNCNFTDGIATITLNVINCGIPLDIKLLSFGGKSENGHAKLSWSTSQETTPVTFEVEKSTDGINFHKVATIKGHNNLSATSNRYFFTDSSFTQTKTFYRIALLTSNGARTQSQTIILHHNIEEFTVTNLINPFKQTISFDVITTSSTKLEVVLLDPSGHVIKKQSYPVARGVNNLLLNDLPSLSAGMYILQVQQNGVVISRKVMKQ